MASVRVWLLMVLPFVLWGTAMTAMAPLLTTGGSWLVASLRLLPAGIALLLWVRLSGRRLSLDRRDFAWFALFTLVDACLFQGLLAHGLEGTGAGLGSVLIDCQPLLVALLARCLFAESINPFGWFGLGLGFAGSSGGLEGFASVVAADEKAARARLLTDEADVLSETGLSSSPR